MTDDSPESGGLRHWLQRVEDAQARSLAARMLDFVRSTRAKGDSIAYLAHALNDDEIDAFKELSTNGSLRPICDAPIELADPNASSLLVVDGNHIATFADHRNAKLLTRALKQQSAKRADRTRPAALADAQLAAGQARAAVMALEQPVSLILGGPGTGKTHVAGAIVTELLASGETPDSIGVAAPTGKAAERLRQSMPGAVTQVMTLHRLLEHDGRRFQRGHSNPLTVKTVIVDEVSMISESLAAALLIAARHCDRLIFLGDAAQLNAVAPGDFMNYLIASVPTENLTQNFRVDAASRSLVTLYDSIRDGDVVRFEDALNHSSSATCIASPSLSEVTRTLRQGGLKTRTMNLNAPSAADFAEIARASGTQVLSPRTSGRFGTIRLNQLAVGTPTPSHRFQPGDKVLVNRNLHARSLYNGDVGHVIADVDGSVHACFKRDESLQTHPLEEVAHALTLAYALTIHKSQGSEYDSVALVLGDAEALTRPLLYTAVTRGKRALTLWGPSAAMHQALRRVPKRTGVLAIADDSD